MLAANNPAKTIVLFFEYSIAPEKLEIINVKDDAIRTADNVISILCLFNTFTSISPFSISKKHKSSLQQSFPKTVLYKPIHFYPPADPVIIASHI
jgi:hypothetical protein